MTGLHPHPFTITTVPNGAEYDWTHPTDCPDGQTCDIIRRTHRMGSENMTELGSNRPDGTYNLAMFGFHSLCLIDDDGHILDPAPATPAAAPNLGTPNGCRECGINERPHGRQYTEQAGWHTFQAPTQDQIKTRMRARRNPQS